MGREIHVHLVRDVKPGEKMSAHEHAERYGSGSLRTGASEPNSPARHRLSVVHHAGRMATHKRRAEAAKADGDHELAQRHMAAHEAHHEAKVAHEAAAEDPHAHSLAAHGKTSRARKLSAALEGQRDG